MPFTYYVFKAQRHQRVPIKTIDHPPFSYSDLKRELVEVMMQTYQEYGIVETRISLEQHLGGSTTAKTSGGAKASAGGYSNVYIHWRRGEEFSCTVLFNPRTEEIRVRGAKFGANTYQMRDDYKAEHGDPFEVPPIVPRSNVAQDDPRALLKDQSAASYAYYSRKPQRLYDPEKQQPQRHGPYGQMGGHGRSYLPRSQQVKEQMKQRKG